MDVSAKTFYVMIGVPGSGKSAFARSIPNAVVISTDSIREEMYGDRINADTTRKNVDVFKAAYKSITDTVWNKDDSRDVVFDATNTTKRGRKEVLRRLYGAGCRKVAVLCMPPLWMCFRNNEAQKTAIPQKVIGRMYRQLVRDGQSIPNQFDELVFLKTTDTKFGVKTV